MKVTLTLTKEELHRIFRDHVAVSRVDDYPGDDYFIMIDSHIIHFEFPETVEISQ